MKSLLYVLQICRPDPNHSSDKSVIAIEELSNHSANSNLKMMKS